MYDIEKTSASSKNAQADSKGVTVLNQDDGQDGYTLLRLVLIDSLCPGRIIELPLDGGAVLTGRNGRGKTSLLQLLLLFYGESPNRIVTTEAGRENFVGYYLPRTTSYIGFEYQRHGGHKRMVVAYSDRSGERVLYRFIRSGFEVTQFIQDNGDFVKVPDFRTHLQTHGFQCSERQIESQTEYKNIIQGIPSNTTDKSHLKYLRELTQEYSFTTSKQPLRQIEKIVSGMFRRKTNFDDLQSMVIDCVSDDLASHSISGDRRKIEDWPKGYKAYMSVMALAPKMITAEQAETQLQAAEFALGEICAKFRSLIAHLDQQIHQQSREKGQLEALAEEEKSQYQVQHTAITGDHLQALRNTEFADGKAQELKRTQDAYEKQNIQALDVRVRNAQHLRNNLVQAEKRREALLGAQSEIAARYERLKQIAKETFSQHRDDQYAKRQKHADACELCVRQLEEAFDASDKVAKEEDAAKRKQLDDAVQIASSEHGRCLHGVDHPNSDPKMLELLERKQIALESGRAEKARVENQRRALEDAYRQAMQDFQSQVMNVSGFHRQVGDAERELTQKRIQLAPQEGTLLHFLRLENSNWSADIAKVIRSDLLDRTDLNPGMSESNNTVFGLSLNLERLVAHPASDIGVAEHEVEVAETRLKQAQSVHDKARLLLAQVGEIRDTAENARRSHELTVQKANAQVQSAQAEVDEAKRQVDASKLQALTLAKQQLDRAQHTLQEAKQTIVRFDELARAESNKLRDQYTQKRRDQQKKRDDEINLINAEIAVLQSQLQSNITKYDAERDEVLLNQGVDTSKLKSVDDEIEQINVELLAIRGFIKEVQQWQYWKENEWPKLADFEAEAQKSRLAHQKHSLAIDDLYAQWQRRSQWFQEQSKQFGVALAGLYEQRKLVSNRVDTMLGYPEVCVSDYDDSWTFDALSSLANQYTKDVNRLLENIRRTIGEVASGFRLHHGTPPEQYLQTSLASLSPAPSREWIIPFKAWFSKSHQEYQRILLMDAVSIAGEVNAFHRSMEEFHLRVQQFNRELQEHLDTSLAFESISKIGVEVVSTIKELKYWSAICEMAEAHRAWSGNGSNELPPPEFALTIERLLEHWEVKTGIRADLKNLIRIQGEVTENGNRRIFKRASDLEAVSSNGLSYLVLATIFVAFINRIRRSAKVNIIWALDELKDLDSGNVVALVELLERNHITLVCAFPDPDPETMVLFKHRFTVEPDRRLAEVHVAFEDQSVELTTDTETHDAWFRAKVQEALDDTRPTIPHQQVMDEMQALTTGESKEVAHV